MIVKIIFQNPELIKLLLKLLCEIEDYFLFHLLVVMLVNDGNDESIVERTLCQLPFVHVFRIPVRKSSGKFE